MSKQRSLEAKLERVLRLRKEEASPEGVALLRSALQDRSFYLVAEAAEIVAAKNLTELADDLAAAFDRFMVEPEETDKGCRALIAITEALNQLDYQKPEVFLRGLKHVQKPWDQDYAAPLRGYAAIGLARIEHPGVINLLVELLFDTEEAARVGAVRALAGTGKSAVIPLLRYKALAGDPESSVIGACFAGLIALDPREAIPFVAGFLRGRSEVQQEAALALGESRKPDAFEPLAQTWRRGVGEEARDTLLLAIAMLRLPATVDFLLEIVAGKEKDAALGALRALAIHRHNPDVRKRAQATVAGKVKELQDLYEKKFRVDD